MRIVNSAVLYDHLTFHWCQQLRCRESLITFSRWVSRTADGHLYALFGIVLLLQQNYRYFTVVASAFAVERALYFFLKKFTRRSRPPEAIPNFKSIIQASDKFSFPSGHTSAAFLMAALLINVYPMAAWIFYPWACSVAFARVMLGVHFPTDTLAGATLGTAVSCAALSSFSVLV